MAGFGGKEKMGENVIVLLSHKLKEIIKTSRESTPFVIEIYVIIYQMVSEIVEVPKVSFPSPTPKKSHIQTEDCGFRSRVVGRGQ